LISTLKKKTNATAIQRTNRFGLNATDRDRNRHRGRYRHRSRHRVGLWDPKSRDRDNALKSPLFKNRDRR
jgi:hypothetical protein